MKFTYVVSALASILVLCGHNTFAVDISNQIDELNYDHGKSQANIAGKASFEEQNNVENKKYNTLISYYTPKSIGRAVVSGQAISYVWSSLDKLGNSIRDICASDDMYGVSYDALLRLGAEVRSSSSGIKYGVDFQVAVPSVQGEHFGKKAALNRGSRVFAATPYGDFSIGYQEGVESIMRVDASNIVAGDDSNVWTRHIRGMLAEEKNSLGYFMYPFLFSAGLYSENVFRNSDNAVLDDACVKGKDFVNNLPFRLSYQSPSYTGFRFGISYSPKGYEFNLFDKKFNNFKEFDEKNLIY